MLAPALTETDIIFLTAEALSAAALCLCCIVILQRDHQTAPLWARAMFAATGASFGLFALANSVMLSGGALTEFWQLGLLRTISLFLIAAVAIARAINPASMPNPYADKRGLK